MEVGVQTWPERRKGRQEGKGEEMWGERVEPGGVDSGPSLGDHASQPSLSGLSGARILPLPLLSPLPTPSTKLPLSSLSHVSRLILTSSFCSSYILSFFPHRPLCLLFPLPGTPFPRNFASWLLSSQVSAKYTLLSAVLPDHPNQFPTALLSQPLPITPPCGTSFL